MKMMKQHDVNLIGPHMDIGRRTGVTLGIVDNKWLLYALNAGWFESTHTYMMTKLLALLFCIDLAPTTPLPPLFKLELVQIDVESTPLTPF